MHTVDRPKITVLGATGAIGSKLCPTLKEHGYDVVVVSRNPDQARLSLPGMHGYTALDLGSRGTLAQALEESQAVINLCGTPLVVPFPTKEHTRKVRESRITLTHDLCALLAGLSRKPELLINASAIGYYGFHDITDETFDEESPPASEYQGTLARDWEAAAMTAELHGIRTVCIRTGIVLDSTPRGALMMMALPFKLLVGGPAGIARCWRSWIHIDDEVGIMLHSLRDPAIHGALNATSPNPLRNVDFSLALGKILRRPSWIPIPEALIRIALGDASEVITRGKKVLPARSLATGYQFRYPHIEHALESLMKDSG
jgi:uncharacterized protein (TIGR01777 family)